MAQLHREDSVGVFARLSFTECMGFAETEFYAWVEDRKKGAILKAGIDDAEKEYAEAIEDLKRGKKTTTFPQWLNKREQNFEESDVWSRHRGMSEVTASDHLDSLQRELQEEISSKTVVYLDTCHWIRMREWVTDHPKKSFVYGDILDRLRQLRKSNRIICPISYPLYQELMKQSDTASRESTARLMDELSGGVCLQREETLLRSEIYKTVTDSVFGRSVPIKNSQVWTKIGWMLHEKFPVSEAFNPDDNIYIQKVILDANWKMSFEDILEEIDQSRFPHLDGSLITLAYNSDFSFYKGKNISFAKILEREKGLMFHLKVKEPFLEIAKEIFDKYPDEVAKKVEGGHSKRLPDPFLLPSMQIIAGINTVFITSGAPFKANDLADSEHASLALPYCDLFFCDGPLAHKLKVKPLELGKTFEAVVISDPKVFLNFASDL